MPRTLRIDGPDTWHHVMNRGVDRDNVFVEDADRLRFEHLLGEATTAHDVEVHAYCLMGNHYHALVRSNGGDLSGAMQLLGTSYVRWFNDRYDRDGPLFRGRFHSVPIDDERQLVAAFAYVHRNPIDLMPAAVLGAYRWSSYGVYLGRRPAPDWLRVDALRTTLPLAEHRQLVEIEATGRATDVPQWLIDRAVATAFPMDDARHRHARILTTDALTDISTSRLAQRLTLASPGAARTALSRARRARSDDPGLARAIDLLIADLEQRAA